MMKVIKFLIASLLLCSSQAFALSEAKITIKVINEVGMPLEGVRVGITYNTVSAKGEVIGFTDASGLFTSSSEAVFEVGGNAKKDGYYQTMFNYMFRDIKSGRLLPWNPEVTLVLRKIGHPVPMYARYTKDTKLEIPLADKEIGFDLIEYDWVAPYGKGQHADFIFKLDKRHVNEDDFESTLTLTFSNKFDGIQLVKENRQYGSVFKLPRTAPLAGYQSKLSRTIKRTPGKGIEQDFHDDNNYIFRVRSVERGNRVLRAMYGKIQGDIAVYPGNSKTARIVFKYYLNPDYTQNLEYDPNQNLFLDLRDLRKLDWVGLE